MGYNAWLNMHKCPFVIRHNLTSKAVGRDINMPSIIIAKWMLPVHTAHAHSGYDVTSVSYALYINSSEVIGPLKEQSISTSGNLAKQ